MKPMGPHLGRQPRDVRECAYVISFVGQYICSIYPMGERLRQIDDVALAQHYAQVQHDRYMASQGWT